MTSYAEGDLVEAELRAAIGDLAGRIGVAGRDLRTGQQFLLEPDGSFRIVIAHQDPGVPNWIDTENRPFGMVFWRYFLPEGEIETPQAKMVKLADL